MSYSQMVRRRGQKRYSLWQAFRRNPSFARYYKQHIDKAKKYVAELKETIGSRDLAQPPHAFDPEYYVIMSYLKLPEGRNLAKRLRLSPPPRSIVRVSTMDGPAGILTLEIKLKHSRTEVIPALERTLRYYRRRVIGKSRVNEVPSHPPIIHDPEKDSEECRYVEVDLRHSNKDILQAINSLLPQKPPSGPHHKQKRKVDPWMAFDAVKKYGSIRKAAQSLGVKESTFKYAYYQARALVNENLPKGYCDNCQDKGSRSCPCPEVEAYANQDRVPLSDSLPPKPIVDPRDKDGSADYLLERWERSGGMEDIE
jgi:hypothetical protein